jgi:hypothetical protein
MSDFINDPEKPVENSDDSFEFMNTPKKSPVDKKNKTPTKFTKIGESIYNRGKEFLNSVELKRQEIASTEHSFKPKINAKSEKMIKNAAKEGRNPREKKIKEEVKPEVDEEEKKVKVKGNVKEFIERNYTQPVTNKIKPPEKSEELDSECTFQPKIDEKSKELAHNSHVDLFKQAEDLKRKKQEKIEEALRKKTEAELDQCTFRPKITKVYGNYSPQGKLKKTLEIPNGYSKNKTYKLY